MESILLVGYEPPLLKRIKNHLIKRGFEVTALALSDLQDLEEFKERFALALLDTQGNGRLADGVGRIRGHPSLKELPLLALLKEEQVSELPLIKGLEDFLVTPASPEMVEARIRFLLRRLNHAAPGTGIRIGALALDVDRYEVTLDGQPLELTYKEFELMKFLATHPGRVFSRDQLLNQVWGYDFIGGTRTVDVHIRRLRAKLGPKYASLIDTVRNVGYKFLEDLS